jgi:SAM-dependent methyltransferase
MADPERTSLTPAAATQAALRLARALERAPDWTTKAAFASCAARAQFSADDSAVRAALTAAITEAWTIPHDLFRPALSLIRLDERIAGCVRRANDSWPARPSRSVLFGADGLAALAADQLLHALLEAAPVTSIRLERFLSCARHALLEIAASEPAPDAAQWSALSFHAALARQCFINEFVFDCPAAEQRAAASCRARLLALLDAEQAVPPFLLLAAAAYSPLHLLRGAERLLTGAQPGPVDEVLTQQIREPLEEQALRRGVTRLTPITDSVSAAVRDQYEQNPYPRWVRMPLGAPPLPFNAGLRRILPFADFRPLPDDSAPEVLVAGCGTGRDAIFVARQFRGARVLAIDLSLGSIGYARRKTQELGLANLEYAQADILGLGDIARSFDIVGAVGVLHHLADPFAGWRVLLSRLRPGGFMCVGLYSRIARRPVLKAREFIAARGYTATPDDIRRFRQEVVAADTDAETRSLSQSLAFYSLSECRDLVFNVQEQHLTLGEIGSFLSEAGLRLIGFELDPRVLSQYRERFRDDPACTKLRNWARFEADNPDTFTAMYKFWVQRAA